MKMRMENDKYGISCTYSAPTIDEIGGEFTADMLAAGFGEVHVHQNVRDGLSVLVDDGDEIALSEIVEEMEEVESAEAAARDVAYAANVAYDVEQSALDAEEAEEAEDYDRGIRRTALSRTRNQHYYQWPKARRRLERGRKQEGL